MKRVVVLTGAAGGIGLAIIERLLEDGFFVCATDLKTDPLKHFSDNLQEEKRSRLLVQTVDVTQVDSIFKAEQAVLSEWGPIDILINNAGIFSSCSFEELTEEELIKTFEVNFFGCFRATRIFTRSMLTRKQGKVINISSIASTKGAPLASHYAATKGALNSFSLSLANELAKYKIQVNSILPGYVETPLMDETDREVLKKISAFRVPMRRLGQAWEVAEWVSYLSQSKSDYLTGSQIVLDGGFSIG